MRGQARSRFIGATRALIQKQSRRTGRPAALVVAALLAVSSPVLAHDTVVGPGFSVGTVLRTQTTHPAKKKPIKNRKLLKPAQAPGLKTAKVEAAPELDSSAFGSAAVLLLGGTLVAIGRRRRAEECLSEGSVADRPS